jgi:hypothetical protein
MLNFLGLLQEFHKSVLLDAKLEKRVKQQLINTLEDCMLTMKDLSMERFQDFEKQMMQELNKTFSLHCTLNESASSSASASFPLENRFQPLKKRSTLIPRNFLSTTTTTTHHHPSSSFVLSPSSSPSRRSSSRSPPSFSKLFSENELLYPE